MDTESRIEALVGVLQCTKGGATVGMVMRRRRLTLSQAREHIAFLETAGFIEDGGRTRHYRPTPKGFGLLKKYTHFYQKVDLRIPA